MTTQYISHGVSWAGSEVRRALKDAKIGKRMVVTVLGDKLAKNLQIDVKL